MAKCPICKKDRKKLYPSTIKNWGTDELAYPKGICKYCKATSTREATAGLNALFG
jgi:hypothetical protein